MSKLIIMKEKTLDFSTTPFIKIKFYIKIKNTQSLMLSRTTSLSIQNASLKKFLRKSALKPMPVTTKTTSGSLMKTWLEFLNLLMSQFRKYSQNYNSRKKEKFKKENLLRKKNPTKKIKRGNQKKWKTTDSWIKFVKGMKQKIFLKIMVRLFCHLHQNKTNK